MSNAIQSDLAKSHPAPLMHGTGSRGLHMFLIAAMLVSVVALVAYQLLGCSGCYS